MDRAELVGAEQPPPTSVFQTTAGDVLVTLHKKPEIDKKAASVLSSAKTKTFLRKSPASSASMRSADKENVMPWNGLDPWGGFNKFPEAEETGQSSHRTSKMEQLQVQVQGVVENGIKDATEQRFQKLETGITELREQNQKFENWFGEAGRSNAAIRQEVSSLAVQVKENKENLSAMSTDIRSGFANIEAC